MTEAIDVQNQIRLGFARTLNLTTNGVRFRLFRSSVTVVVIAVAIAFAMNVATESLVMRSIRRMTWARSREGRLASRWASRLSVPGTVEEILVEVARGKADGPVSSEAVAMGALSRGEVQSYHKGASEADSYLRFFEGLDHLFRRELVRNAAGAEILDRLSAPEALKDFRRKLKKMRSVRFPGSPAGFRGFLARWPGIRARTEAIRARREEAIAKVEQGLLSSASSGGGRTVNDGLAELGDPESRFLRTVTAAGFVFDEGAPAVIAEQAQRTRDMRALEETVRRLRVRRLIAAEIDAVPAEVNSTTLWKLLRKRRRAAWYVEKLRDIEQVERLDLFCRRVRSFLRELEEVPVKQPVSNGPAPSGAPPTRAVLQSLRARYLKDDGTDTSFHDARSDKAVRRLSVSARDAWRLVERFRGDAQVSALDSYGTLVGLIETQCEPTDAPVVPSQSDPDAGDPPAGVSVKGLMALAGVDEAGDRGVPAYALTVDRAHALARGWAERAAFDLANLATEGMGGGLLGAGWRMTFLLVAAMFVSIVGVTNAMLMSVTERFREIATLKCLGALDGTIMLIFVLEAGMLGVVGGLAGAVAGVVIGVLRMLGEFGGLVVAAFPAAHLSLAVLIFTVVGVILAAMASLYPSFRAARLAPMEAMRIQ